MKKISIALLFIFCAAAVRAQTFTIVEGTGYSNGHVLTNNNDKFGLHEYIYLKSEINRSGSIAALQFKPTRDINPNNVDIYMVEIDKEKFTTTSDWVTPAAQ